MKITVLFFLSCLFGVNSYGQFTENRIQSSIDEVKLYLTAGEIGRIQDVKVVKGRNKLVFTGISAYVDPQSIQFKSDDAYKLVSVSTEMDFFAGENLNPRIVRLKDSMNLVKSKITSVQDLQSAYSEEKMVLTSNRDLGGKGQNITALEIEKAADFYRARMTKINNKVSALRKESEELNRELLNIRGQLAELNFKENERSNQIIVLIDCEETKTIATEVKYMVSDCGWAATYDLSAEDLSKNINLKYKAQVYNNTGNDWNDVGLILSTGDPALSASHPELKAWILNEQSVRTGFSGGKKMYYAAENKSSDYRYQAQQSVSSMNQRVYEEVVNDNFEQVQNTLPQQFKPVVNTTQIEVSELATEFPIDIKYSIPTDAKPYIVDVKEHSLIATFSHIAIPKLDKGAFLLANIVGWQELDLIPGPTNVYFGGNYVGVSQIDTRNVSDTLGLSFGRDNKVIVMRKLKDEFTIKKVVGNSRKDTYTYEVVIRNNRETPISIDLLDQVPISRTNSITVNVEDLSNGKMTEENGEVEWKMNLAPGASKTVKLSFTVKYPKEMNLKMKSYRTISAPSF